MKIKRKIMAMGMILLLVLVQCSIIQAGELKNQTDDKISIEIGSIDENGETISETVTVTKDELAEFETQVSVLLEKIESASSWGELEKIFENLQSMKGFLMNLLTKIFSKFKIFGDRGLVISSGHCFKLNPFKKNDMNMRQKRAFWHYSNNGETLDKTYIIKPFKFKMDVLQGFQFGFMSKFFGLYIYIAKRFPQKNYTFFMGTAKRINGMDFDKIE